jgi:hypothetical protein
MKPAATARLAQGKGWVNERYERVVRSALSCLAFALIATEWNEIPHFVWNDRRYDSHRLPSMLKTLSKPAWSQTCVSPRQPRFPH